MPEKAKDYIKKNINLWQPYTNLKFNFVTTLDGDIRISGKNNNTGNWSAIGTNAKLIPLDEPTMHIDLFQTADVLNQSIRHEFGHALGLLHEHQHPDHSVQWDEKKVHNESKKLGLSKEEADKEILTVLSRDTATHSTYDPRSVLHYKVEPWLTLDGCGVDFNEEISEGDKKFLASLYPPTAQRHS